ncbi:hypothetical protein PPERSA_05585 [Pseudocohnilembus persalinus]|uniref:Serine aminopeptidase S33 domain-containing protein n=1 Tax=Pseudocohnilembus persalinus TaxID=266149 RepID=A0A0V0Q7T8_PSEPJ|nr:hypothetical protein PPERSA_05585 [Pseudocohnilembus persalinus]|eukprot:KRW98241.1 hypothetical protein PPERSA_05585 [Pseudocohnilembus persalinus]
MNTKLVQILQNQIVKTLQQRQKNSIFSKFGLGTPKDVYKRHKQIFSVKNESNPNIQIPRKIDIHKFPEARVHEYKVKDIDSDQHIDLCTYRYKFDPQLQIQQPKALMFQFHGMHNMADSGAHIAESLSKIGVTTYSIDYRGHGRSNGLRGYNKDINQHVQDAIDFIHLVLEKYDPKIPKFISGLSLGGLTAYLITSRFPDLFKGAILYAPALMPIHNKVDQKLAEILNKYIPKLPFLPPNPNTSNKYKEIGEILSQEKFNGRNQWLKPSMANMIFQGMKEFEATHTNYKTPYLLVQGGIDKLVDPIQAEIMLQNTKSEDKQLIYYENAWHDLWHEQEIDLIIPQVNEWVLKRI